MADWTQAHRCVHKDSENRKKRDNR